MILSEDNSVSEAWKTLWNARNLHRVRNRYTRTAPEMNLTPGNVQIGCGLATISGCTKFGIKVT